MIPLADLRPEHAALEEELVGAFREIVRSGRFVLGEAVASFEAALAARVGTSQAVTVASGSDALFLSLRAAGIGPGHVVVTSSLSFVATAEAIARTGARPAFADVDRETFQLEPGSCAAAVAQLRREGHDVRAVLAVHLFGQCAPMSELAALAADERVVLVEDAAQAFGAAVGERRAGALGRVAAHSFFPTKNLGALGDGGAVTTDDGELAAVVRRLRQHGFGADGDVRDVGLNSRLDALQAALLHVKLAHLDAALDARRAAALRYDALLAAAAPQLVPQRSLPATTSTFHQYVVRCARRDAVIASLAAEGIEARAYYARPLHRMAAFAPAPPSALPVTDALASELLALPFHARIEATVQERVVAALARALR